MNAYKKSVLGILLLFALVIVACDASDNRTPVHEGHLYIDRESLIPEDALKITPETDHHPPQLHSDDYEVPIPLPYPVNTAGLEDSPFILPDGKTLYFFYTPNSEMAYHEQLVDGVSGIYVTYFVDGVWTVPERVWLTELGKLALDGCPAVIEDTLWFCSAREGFTGVNMFTAQKVDGEWTNIEYVGDTLMKDYHLGEVHPHGSDLYYHSERYGGKGGLDIWRTSKINGQWSEPVNIEVVNTEEHESLPFITYDGEELWFTRTYLGTPGIFRSKKGPEGWEPPELIVSMFAGEPTLDLAGNLYFIHHYYQDGVMIEADIYVAMRKVPKETDIHYQNNEMIYGVLEPRRKDIALMHR